MYYEYSYYNFSMKFCIVVNDGKKKAREIAADFVRELEERNLEYYYFDGSIPLGTSAAVVFGGDGTILKFIRTGVVNVPVLGINCGKMGFLAEAQRPASEYVDKLVRGEYELDKRKLLRIDCQGEIYYALNEVVLGRADSINLVDIEVATDEDSLDRYRADGVIVATPTGSTAYSLSAGGPVLSPKVPAYIVTPVCPHGLHSRPIVISDDEVINVTAKTVGNCIVVIDGVSVTSSENGLSLRVSTDGKCASFIRTEKRSFYKTMLNKMTKEG